MVHYPKFRHTCIQDMQTNNLPVDLTPLPTMPYNQRPAELPLDIEECRTAIWRMRGNITKAAELLKVPSKRLRDFVKRSPYLSAEQAEANEQLKDIAEDVIYEALTDTSEDYSRRDAMAKFVMLGVGKDRGYGSGGGASVSIKNTAGGTINIAWADGTSIGPQPPTIDGEVNHE